MNERNINKHKKAQAFCLTFDEIEKLYQETQKVIKANDYGFTPIMMIRFEEDAEWEEKEYVSVTPLHEFTKAIMDESENKPNITWADITDENKFDFI
jgi:hypothetical protein